MPAEVTRGIAIHGIGLWGGEMIYIPDPLEILEARAERMMDRFVDEYTCMECGNRYDYEMTCVDPHGYGPIVCNECLGFDPMEAINADTEKMRSDVSNSG